MEAVRSFGLRFLHILKTSFPRGDSYCIDGKTLVGLCRPPFG